MIKLKYFLILFLLVLIFVAFKYQSFIEVKQEPEKVVIAPTEEKKPELPIEIKESVSKFDSIISAEINETKTVGAAVIITYKDQVAYLKCFGVKKVGGKDSIDKNTIFRLASVSKTVSGTLASILSDEGEVNLDDKVVDYIPGFLLSDSISTQNLTIKNILSHTSGLVPHAYDNLIEEHVPFSKVMNDLYKVEIGAEPGKLYGYQNVMFSLFDTISHAATSKSFDELMHEKIFNPFEMRTASTGFDAFKNNNNKALPHYGGNGKYRTLRLNNRYYSTAPAAGVNASISDMGNFLITLLNSNSTAISNNARNIVFEPQIYTPLKRRYLQRWDKVDSRHYSIGWRIIGYKNRKIAYHGGYVEGYRAEIALCQDENIGIVYLTNSPNTVGSKTVPTFLNQYFKILDQTKI